MRHPIIINFEGKISIRQKTVSSIIAKYLSSHAGRAKLASSMLQPLRTTTDYNSIGRKVFSVESVPEVVKLSCDNIVENYYKHQEILINSRGKIQKRYVNRIKSIKITIPKFELYDNPTVRISEVKRRRFNFIDRY